MPGIGQLGGWLSRFLGDWASLFQSSPDSKSSYDSEIPSSQEVSSVALRASCLPDAHQGDPCDVSWLRRASSRVISLSRGTCQYQKSLGPLGPQKAPTSNSNDPELSAELDSPGSQEDPEILRSQALRSTLDQRSMLSKVTWKSGVSTDGSFLVPQFPSLTNALMGSLPCRVRGFWEIP